ncbi:ABC transporter substrate-binding protein [Photobacterium sp. MCCC 1A19761]|uniref:ABC transporter substrate-binding protein n=1 Tax=Photobacterium sp. MCCC 1A19761 TaxID=3115000 RepID=UPI00307CF27E
MPSVALAAESKPIVILTTFSERSIAQLVERYQAQFPGTEIRVIFRRTQSAHRLLNKEDAQNIDIIISSSPTLFNRLSNNEQLTALSQGRKVPDWLQPHVLDMSGKVSAFGYSGAGLMYNRQYLDSHHLSPPTSWEDLAQARYYHHITMSTPSRSGSTNLMVENILQYYGWEAGWRLLMQIGGNIAFISSRSFGVSEAVSKGLIGAGPVIDSYGIRSRNRFAYIGFRYLPNAILMPAYIGLSRKSHALETSRRFVDFLLSQPGQQFLETSSMAKQSLNQPELALKTTFILDKEVVYNREPLIAQLFDQAITHQLQELNSIWKTIHQLEANRSSLSVPHQQLLDEAKHLASRVPVTAAQAGDPAYLALFQNERGKRMMDPAVTQELQQWKRALAHNLRQANLLLDQLSPIN